MACEKETLPWIEYPRHKPKEDCMCYVTNVKAGIDCFGALYCERWDIFREYDPSQYNHRAVEVTHYVVLPNPPPMRE